MGLGDFFAGFATILGPLGTLVPGGQALAALATLGVKLTAGGAGEPIYYRPFADPTLAKPFGMFARPAALVPAPKQKKGTTLRLARLVKQPNIRGKAPFAATYDDVSQIGMPDEWSVPLYRFTLKQAKKLEQELKIGAAPGSVKALQVLGVKYQHPQRALAMPPQDAYTTDIASVWTELAEIGVALRLQAEGLDPAWAWWFSDSPNAIAYFGRTKTIATAGRWSARLDPFALDVVDDQDLDGPSLDGGRLEDADALASKMLGIVDSYRQTERQRIAELREFQAEVQDFAQEVIDDFKAGKISLDEWRTFVESTTGANTAFVPPDLSSSQVEHSPSGFPNVPSARYVLIGFAALAVFLLWRGGKL